ncbi:hypothetical protein [Burkholderia ubonensis]|uniref:hypothetical protein n=1 Tax=Burkholderia ubonensis TaxID=101571 RepID=UPI000A6AC82C|nr:hypothetical protein [Burkholderia ubonensis]
MSYTEMRLVYGPLIKPKTTTCDKSGKPDEPAVTSAMGAATAEVRNSGEKSPLDARGWKLIRVTREFLKRFRDVVSAKHVDSPYKPVIDISTPRPGVDIGSTNKFEGDNKLKAISDTASEILNGKLGKEYFELMKKELGNIKRGASRSKIDYVHNGPGVAGFMREAMTFLVLIAYKADGVKWMRAEHRKKAASFLKAEIGGCTLQAWGDSDAWNDLYEKHTLEARKQIGGELERKLDEVSKFAEELRLECVSTPPRWPVTLPCSASDSPREALDEPQPKPPQPRPPLPPKPLLAGGGNGPLDPTVRRRPRHVASPPASLSPTMSTAQHSTPQSPPKVASVVPPNRNSEQRPFLTVQGLKNARSKLKPVT